MLSAFLLEDELSCILSTLFTLLYYFLLMFLHRISVLRGGEEREIHFLETGNESESET